ncbi:MAG TPA: serine/threonine-protein kinase, partial [Gemmataceae bacterium]|nr:serine/threonine-protein kinase [Gemmataceae bacterium]
RRRSDGSWLVEQADLSREMYQRAESLVVPADGADLLPRPERLYLRPSADPLGKLRALHPLVLYDAEADEVLFLNSRRGKARTEYLDYSSGRVVEKAELAGEQRELLRQVLNLPAEEIALDAWAARLATEEGAEIVPTAGESPHEPRRLGEFELISELGRGAMGIVYRAEQPSLHRQVAVKRMFRTGDPKAEARFAREIRALGQVDHPHLVKIHASGSEGEHWFYAMERIEGATLAAVCDRLQSRATTTAGLNLPTWQDAISSACVEARHHEQPLSGDVRADVGVDAGGESGLRPEDSRDLSERVPHLAIRSYERHVAELIRQVAEAVHALHEKGIIHRDIKPGNIMVTTDGSTAVLMDLGLAQIADEVEGRLTRTRQFVGTLRYASPEQVQAVRRLDARSDVYSLGATLWEMLTLQPLFGATEATPTPKLMEQIGLEEPGHVRTHNRSASRDLEKIVEKCLQKKAADRYATARELAEDLRRYLGDEPVRARKVTSLERGLKWVRRRPALACTIAAAIVAVTLVTALAFAQILTERNRLRVERDRAEANLLRSLVSDTRAQMLARDTGWWWKAMENLESATRLDVPGRDVSELRDLAIQCMGTEYPCFRLTRTWQGHSGPVTSLAVAPNGRMAVTGGDDRTVRLWSVPDGKQLAVLTGPTQRVTSVSFHPSGRFIAAGSADGFVRLWDLRSGSKDEAELAGLDRRTSSLELSAAATAVEFSPDGKWLAIGCQDGAVRIMAANADELAGSGLAPTGTPGHRVLKGHHGAITCLAFVPVSMQLASSSEDRTIRFWEPASGEQMSTVSTRSVARCIAFHGGGTILAYAEPAAYGFNLQDLRTGVSLGRGNVHGGAVTQIRSDARNRLLTASLDGTLKLWWDGQSSRDRWTVLLAVAREHLSECRCAAFGPGDAPWVIAGHADGQVRLWELSEPPQRALVPGGTQQAVFLGPRRVLCPPFSCDFDRRNRGADVVLLPPPVTALAVHPSDHRFAFAREGAVHVWDSKERKELTSWPAHDAKINALVCRPDGEQLVSAAADGTIRLWDWKGKSKGTLPAAKIEAVHALAWDRTGRRLAASGSCGAVIWDMRSGAGPQRISEHHLSASAIAFGLDVLAVSGPDGTVDVLSIETGARLRTLRGHSALVSALEFAPDGSELASAAPDGTIRLWDTKTWSELAALREETTLGTSLSFDPSGCYLAANGSHNTQLWDLKTSRVVALLDGDQCGRINAESEILLGTGGGSVMRYALSELIHPQAVDGASGKGPRLSGPLLVDPQPPLVLGPENPNRIWGMAVSPNGRWFVTATFDGGVFLWDAQSFKCVRSLTGQGGEVWCAAFSSDSRYLASGGIRGNSGEIKIWDASTGEEVWDCPGHTDEVTALAFHPTRPWLASGSDDG